MTTNPKKLAILVGGGPAPGVNSVIGAVTIRAVNDGIDVIGIEDGFKWIMQGDISHVTELSIEDVSRIHFLGGAYIGIARNNPTKDKKHLETTVTSLLRLNVDKLVTVGGDDTAFSAMKIEETAAGRIRVVHIPKTIDNDLDLPLGICTFGYQTARHVGVGIVKHLMVDAQTTSRWFFVVSMGRQAGHLALGIGKSAGATLTLIPEEFPGNGPGIRLSHVVDILVGAIIKRLSRGREDGVAMIAEGILERLDPKDLAMKMNIERDAHDNLRLSEIGFGEILKYHVQERLQELGLKIRITSKNIGYEMRCADPIPFDMEYCRDLGFCAANFILEGGNAAMVSIQEGNFIPLYFKDMLDPKTNRARVRMVDIRSEYYQIGRSYMIRLSRDDFEDAHELAKFAAVCGISTENFRNKFSYIIEKDMWYRVLDEKQKKKAPPAEPGRPETGKTNKFKDKNSPVGGA
jgi:6-phosphofructokinase